jgi:hypothetical protein
MGESRHQGSEAACPTEAPATPKARGKPELRAEEHSHWQEKNGEKDPALTGSEGAMRDGTLSSEVHQGREEGGRQPMTRWSDPARGIEGYRAAFLTPESQQKLSSHWKQLNGADWRKGSSKSPWGSWGPQACPSG